MDKKLRVIPLGGLGEVGLNLMVIEYGEDMILIDCGVLFPDLSWLGLELVLPNFDYIIENKKKLRALIITHGHEDHIGAIPFLLKKVKIPVVYASRFASRLIEEKCKEHGVGDNLNIENVQAGSVVSVKSFEVEFIHVTHSTLESLALSIKTPLGVIVHSGDFKFDETPYSGPSSDKKRFRELGNHQSPLLLLSDSTNSERCGYSKSESSINAELDKLVAESPSAVIVALFASNIHRVHQLMDIAQKHGRKVFLSGRSMERYVQIALEQNFLPHKSDLIQPIEDIDAFKRNQILVLSTGSQGEARSSLYRLSKNENRWIKIAKGDTVILSSRNIPGNEKAISNVINQLCKLGADVHYEDMRSVHVSGHAYQEEQLELLSFVKPKYFIPIHGEYRQLAQHAKTAQKSNHVQRGCFILENGHVWEFDGESAVIDITQTVISGRKWYFFENDGEFDAPAIKERRSAARAGVVSVVCRLNQKATELVKDPEVVIKGYLGDLKDQKNLIEEVVNMCAQAFEKWSIHSDLELTREQTVALAAKKVFKKRYDLKPLVIVHFTK
ncbi:MAG: ribonuclease J [Oligoflexia bacterium]|nr:ribonuclease J [Oligoflexia bacterium]